MPRFSDRIGVTSEPQSIQVDEMSEELRNSLWNLLAELYDGTGYHWRRVAPHVANYFRKVPVDEISYSHQRDWFKKYFFDLSWYEVYNLLEFLVDNHTYMTTTKGIDGRHSFPHHVGKGGFIDNINYLLERESSGYRFVQGVLTPISCREEVDAIDEAVENSNRVRLHGAAQHIQTAIGLLGKRPEPDYRNAVKEAISAVESVAKLIARDDSSSLDGPMRVLSEKAKLHGALKAGFLKLYGYTSDDSGIRHAILDEPKVGFAEAKYMVVSCSAFVNYLIQKSEQVGLLNSSSPDC